MTRTQLIQLAAYCLAAAELANDQWRARAWRARAASLMAELSARDDADGNTHALA